MTASLLTSPNHTQYGSEAHSKQSCTISLVNEQRPQEPSCQVTLPEVQLNYCTESPGCSKAFLCCGWQMLQNATEVTEIDTITSAYSSRQKGTLGSLARQTFMNHCGTICCQIIAHACQVMGTGLPSHTHRPRSNMTKGPYRPDMVLNKTSCKSAALCSTRVQLHSWQLVL